MIKKTDVEQIQVKTATVSIYLTLKNDALILDFFKGTAVTAIVGTWYRKAGSIRKMQCSQDRNEKTGGDLVFKPKFNERRYRISN